MYSKVRNEKLKGIIRDFAAEYNFQLDDSWNKAVAALKPGQAAPPQGRIVGDERRTAFRSKCENYRQQIKETVADELAELEKKMTEAPSQEAVNAITLFSMRSKLTAGEVDRMLKAYGSNPIAYESIRDIATRQEIPINTSNPTVDRMELINGTVGLLNKFISLPEAELNHTASGTYVSFMEQVVDGLYSAE